MKKIKKSRSHGGRRKGAGRPKGLPNKRTAALREALASALSKHMPLDALLATMRNPDLPVDVRFAAAVKAAPYCHSKPASADQKGKIDLGLGARLEAAIKRLDAEHINGKERAPGDPASALRTGAKKAGATAGRRLR